MIQFDQDLANYKHLWVFNNNIIKFYDDGAAAPLHADIVTTDFTARIYPDPNGLFTFNFNRYLKALAIKNNLADVINFNIGGSVNSLVYDDTANVLYNLECTITITLSEANPVSVSRSYQFIAGVEQLVEFQRQEYPQLPIFLLQNSMARSKSFYHVNYWEGYPFDLSVYCSTPGNLNIDNVSNGLDLNVPIQAGALVNRISFGDANSEITINDFLPLKTGLNRLVFRRPGYDPAINLNETPLNVIINKHEPECGVYIKFRNEKGGWTYWLFHKNKGRERSSSKLEELANDSRNIESTIAPIIQSGVKDSSEVINCFAVGVDANDMRTLEYLIDSPKVYLFTGERFSINQEPQTNQWIEIECATEKLDIELPTSNKQNIPIKLRLPNRYKVGLL